MVYLDANATVGALPGVIEAVASAMSEPTNPASIHYKGIEARRLVTQARDMVCELIGDAYAEGVVFTSGGTEGNNAVIRGFLLVEPTRAVVTTAVEHSSVLQPARMAERLVEVAVDSSGLIDPEELALALPNSGPAPLVAVQWVNGETGVVQPIGEIVSAVRSRRLDAFIVVDAAQAVGRVPVSMDGVDALTCSGHKLHGPPGTGILVLSDPCDRRIPAFILGGGQEGGRRSGTVNVAGAVGLGVAFSERAAAFDASVDVMRSLRDRFEEMLLAGIQCLVMGGGSPRVANTSNIMFPGRDGTAIAAMLDQEGVFCSVGSACSSGKPEPSHVIRAMGYSEDEAYSCVRFSFSVLNTADETQRAAETIIRVVGAMK